MQPVAICIPVSSAGECLCLPTASPTECVITFCNFFQSAGEEMVSQCGFHRCFSCHGKEHLFIC